MKIIGIGDIHGRPYWKQIWEKHSDADKIVFVGDYFDSLDGYTELPVYSAAEQLYNFREICALKREFPDKIVMLLGNHDVHYFPGLKGQTAGFQLEHAAFIQMALEENKDILKMAWLGGNKFLFSHAGITANWLNDIYGKDGWDVNYIADAVNDVWTWKPKAFMFNIFPDLKVKVTSQNEDRGDCIYKKKRVDVKTTSYDTGRLICALWKNDNVDIYVLMVGKFPTYEYRGFSTADELKRTCNIVNLGRGPVYALNQNEFNSNITKSIQNELKNL